MYKILDGILIANEAVDEARRMNNELLMFKVDFEKAYDSVDLNYLNAVMVNIYALICKFEGNFDIDVFTFVKNQVLLQLEKPHKMGRKA